MASPEFTLNIWRLHPVSSEIVRAEETLKGSANPSGVRWCHPYSSVNSCGWWLYPAVDVDIRWIGGKDFEHRLLTPWSDLDHEVIRTLLKISDPNTLEQFCPAGQGRTKFTWSAVEENIVQMWTGCIFETPPGYCLHIRNPVNFPSRSIHIQEGIIETDWMQYDIWTNIIFDTHDWVPLRRNDFIPLAHLIPVRRECVEGDWAIGRNEIINRDDEDSNRVFEYWMKYNHQKFGSGGKQYLAPDRTKDASAFYKARAEVMGKGFEKMVPDSKKIKSRAASRIKIKNRLVSRQDSIH